MPTVTYVEADGASRQIELAEGQSVMRGAVYNGIEGMVGECGGGLACATCHCFVDEAWEVRTGQASEIEQQMLDCAATPARANSRLACQIIMSAELDGLVVRLPPTQF